MGFKDYKRLSKKADDKILKPEILLEEINNKKFKPVMIFFGEEKMRMENAIEYFKKILLPEGVNEFNYELIYCEEGSGVNIYQSFITPPFMGKNKLIVLRDTERLREDDFADISRILKHDRFNGTTMIMMYYQDELPSKGKKTVEFIKEIKDRKSIYKFDAFSTQDLQKKVNAHLKKFNTSIDPDGFSYLIDELGTQQDMIFNILSQLIMYEPEKTRLTLDDVKKFVFNFRGYTVYDFTNAIANKRIDEALRILEISGNTRENLIQLVTPVMRMLEQLYKTKTMLMKNTTPQEIASTLGVPQRIVESEYIPQARNFDREKLLRSMESLSRFDLMLRTSSLPSELIVSNLLFDICL